MAVIPQQNNERSIFCGSTLSELDVSELKSRPGSPQSRSRVKWGELANASRSDYSKESKRRQLNIGIYI